MTAGGGGGCCICLVCVAGAHPEGPAEVPQAAASPFSATVAPSTGPRLRACPSTATTVCFSVSSSFQAVTSWRALTKSYLLGFPGVSLGHLSHRWPRVCSLNDCVATSEWAVGWPRRRENHCWPGTPGVFKGSHHIVIVQVIIMQKNCLIDRSNCFCLVWIGSARF